MKNIAFWRMAHRLAAIFYFVMLVLMVCAISLNLIASAKNFTWHSFAVIQENQLLIVEFYLFFQILGRLLVKYIDVDIWK